MVSSSFLAGLSGVLLAPAVPDASSPTTTRSCSWRRWRRPRSGAWPASRWRSWAASSSGSSGARRGVLPALERVAHRPAARRPVPAPRRPPGRPAAAARARELSTTRCRGATRRRPPPSRPPGRRELDRVVRRGGPALLVAGPWSRSSRGCPGNWAFTLTIGLVFSIDLPLHHARHRHGRAAVALPGHLRRRRRLHGGAARRPPRRPDPPRRALIGARGGDGASAPLAALPALRLRGLPLALLTLVAGAARRQRRLP